MKILTKKCFVCGEEYTKKVNVSKKNWALSKFCSNPCINKGRTNTNGFKKGQAPWNKKYNLKRKCENCNKDYKGWDNQSRFCSRKCARAKQVISPESYAKAALKRTGELNSSKRPKVRQKIRKANLGEKSHLWRGGKSTEAHKIRESAEYRIWRTSVFKRDNWTCVFCKQRGGKLEADHIKPFAYFPELRFEITNGRTLCVPCHKQTDTYGKKK